MLGGFFFTCGSLGAPQISQYHHIAKLFLILGLFVDPWGPLSYLRSRHEGGLTNANQQHTQAFLTEKHIFFRNCHFCNCNTAIAFLVRLLIITFNMSYECTKWQPEDHLIYIFICESQMTVEKCAGEDWLSFVPITPAGRDFNSLLFSSCFATTLDQM